MDLKLTAEHNVWLRNSMVDLEMQGDMSILKNTQGLSISGELSSRQGRVYALGHTFQVTQATLRLDNQVVVDPTLDIVAELPTRIRDTTQVSSQNVVNILITVAGTLSKPQITFSSDPAVMSASDISYYLATNITPEELAAGNTRATFNHLISDRLLSYVSSEVTRRLQGYIGLDVLDLQVPSLGTDAGLKITVGKYVGKKLFVSYTASSTQLEPDAFKVEYFIKSGREIVGERAENGDYDLRLQVKLNY
jgi:autotransporter translocation and assembly factor TamB